MMTLLNLTGLAVTTILAAAAAIACNWLALRAAFYLMQPATVRGTLGGATAQRSTAHTELASGKKQLARTSAPNW
jgi:hypothetical protein